MENSAIWKAVQAELELSVSSVNYSGWIKPITLDSISDSGGKAIVTLKVPSLYYETTVSARYIGQIQAILEKQLGVEAEVVFVVGKGKKSAEIEEETAPLFRSYISTVPGGHHNLNPRLAFDSYVVGSSNNFAYAAAQGVIKNPGKKYNPLFIYGGVGLGKTHLMHAIGLDLLNTHPEWNILYISAETFGSDLVASLQSKKITSFKKRYRSCDVLLVDDVQFIAGKEYIQEEFFHTFNELHMSERQIVLTSDRPPQEIAKLEERLSSRFLGGLAVDVQPPDYEMRMAILTQKARELGVATTTEALSYIAERVTSNARELEGSFRSLVAFAESHNEPLSLELVATQLGGRQEKQVRHLRPNIVLSRVAKYFDYRVSDLIGESRKAPLVRARHIAIYLLRTDLGITHVQIAELLGGRDHTTIMHAVQKIEEEVKKDEMTLRTIVEIRNDLLHT